MTTLLTTVHKGVGGVPFSRYSLALAVLLLWENLFYEQTKNILYCWLMEENLTSAFRLNKKNRYTIHKVDTSFKEMLILKVLPKQSK